MISLVKFKFVFFKNVATKKKSETKSSRRRGRRNVWKYFLIKMFINIIDKSFDRLQVYEINYEDFLNEIESFVFCFIIISFSFG